MSTINVLDGRIIYFYVIILVFGKLEFISLK